MTEPVDPSGAPFVGLRPFDTSDSKWFSGRGREAAALTKKIRNFRFTAVVGPSGSGKSSIVRAGVIPLLLEGEGWRYVVTTPGSAPLAGLAMALSGVADSDRLVEARIFRFDAMLRESTFGLAEIAETLRLDAPKLLLVVDQFEELFRYGVESSGVEQAAMREEARAFIELLLTAASREGGNMHVCITMRSDYVGNCSEYVGLAEALSASQFLVPLPLRSQMEEAIRRPVSQAGGAIEEALVQHLLVDVAEEVDQLPLLQHTLRRLWEKASGSPRTMHEGDYVAVGKIAGSIDKKAKEILEALTAANPVDGETVERVMKALTDLDERDRATRRAQKLSELRALVTDPLSTDPGTAVASLTRILDTLRTKAEDILGALTAANSIDGVTVKRVIKALTHLDERDRATPRTQKRSEPRDLVTDSPGTGTAEASLTRVLDALKAEDTSFLHFGGGDDPEIEIGHEALIRSWKRLAGAKLDFSEGWLREERNDGDRWRGYVRRAGEQDNPLGWRGQRGLDRWLSDRSIGKIWSQRYGNRWSEVAELRVRSSRSTRLKMATALAAAAASILIFAGLTYLWESNKEAALRLTLQQQAEEKRIVSLGRSYFESEGPVPAINIVNEVLKRRLPTGPEAERLLLWSLRQLREKTALMGHRLPLVGADFSRGGQVIVTADANNLFFWKSDDGSKLSSIDLSKLNSIDLRPFGPISGVQWSPRGDQIAVASRDKTRLLFPCSIIELKEILADDCVGEGETQSFIIGDDKKKAGKAKFTTDEQWLVTGSPEEYPKRWLLNAKIGEVSAPDLEYPASMASPSANGFAISEGVDKSVAVIAVGDKSGKIQVFDFASAAKRLTLETPSGEVNGNVLSLAFNPRHPAMLAAAFQDGSVLVWNDWHGDSQHPIKLQGTKGIAYQISFTNNGELLMATSDDGTPLVWETARLDDPHPWQLRGHFGPVYTAAFSSDGKSLVTGSTDKTAIVWNNRPVLDKGSPDPQEASSPNGAATNAASGCGTEIIWTKEFTKAGCVETPLHHVFILSPQGKVMEFDKRDPLTPVDQYQGAKDADGLKLEPGYLVITSKSGDTHWQYFDDFNKLMDQALKNLPQIEGKPLPLKREILCQIDETC